MSQRERERERTEQLKKRQMMMLLLNQQQRQPLVSFGAVFFFWMSRNALRNIKRERNLVRV